MTSDAEFWQRIDALDERLAATDEKIAQMHEQVEALRNPLAEEDDRYVPHKPARTPLGGVWMLRVAYTDSGGMEHTMTDWALTTDALRRAFGDSVEVLENLINAWKETS